MAKNGAEDLLANLTTIISSFCAQLYGTDERNTAVIVRALEAKEYTDATRRTACHQAQ